MLRGENTCKDRQFNGDGSSSGWFYESKDSSNVGEAETPQGKLETDIQSHVAAIPDVGAPLVEKTTNLSQTTEFRQQQKECTDLSKMWERAKTDKGNYFVRDGFLFHRDKILGQSAEQLVVPKCRRNEILELAHASVFGGHMGIKKTLERIRYSFYWENVKRDVQEFCESCESCQLTKPVKVKDRAPITPVARPGLPFQVVNVDLIGPIDPPSSKGHKYILCLVDQHTRWAEAVPLTSLTAKTTCDALLQIFSRTGIPNVIASDNGTNFNADLTREFEKRLGSSPRFSTPMYPQSNGLVERFNQTLKRMLHHIIREEGRAWHVQIPYALWAYREIPNSTTGVSPFQLLYGRPPQGPLSILKSTWLGEHDELKFDLKPIHKYLQDLKERLKRAAEQADLTSEIQQGRMAQYYNLRSSSKTFEIGDRVVVLIPDSSNRLYARWQGPAVIKERKNPHSFLVELADGSIKHVHQNKIRKFIVRSNAINVMFDGEEFGEVDNIPSTLDQDSSFENRKKKPHCYGIPMAYRKEVDKQVKELLELGLIEPSEADIAHPVVCVVKKDATIRMCVDFRALNSITKVPAFPMKDMHELIYVAGHSKWLSSLDMRRGYWQIGMEESSKPLTAFSTHNGTFQWNVMPFGLAGASGTFQREMNKVLFRYSDFAQAYIDDIIIFSNTFEEHLKHLETILKILEQLKFSVRLSKCDFAAKEIDYLGHKIGNGKHGPDPSKIAAIKVLERPTNKKGVRSVLGLMRFYRTYIPNYAEIAEPLTDLTKKNAPNNVRWGQVEDAAFQKLKDMLCQVTSLSTPDFNLPFQVHSDASDVTFGCCLTQRDTQGHFKPIAFASQKFSGAQKSWAVLFGLKKFDKWIFGGTVEIITDHNPLKYLTEITPRSPKLTRWALSLQRWNLKITYRPGVQHRAADALSRLV
ncbi:uncharacterized protein LOC118191743 [Stegodyphus dumicola]|uniref:uncharacterized protein LOC118191743 n=1 Tax=Stegodyphus dumicola TaxID=202533 RepID=UPI0015B11CC4|nr:uncharacterized protein LOC118191743 [Stegodyphus dumicola]